MSLWTLLFSLALVQPDSRIAIRDAISGLVRADFRGYDDFTREKIRLHTAEARAWLSRWRADTFRIEGSIKGLNRVTERIATPLDVSKFEVSGTALSDLKNSTLAQLHSPELIQKLSNNIELFEVSHSHATAWLETILVPYAEKKIRVTLEVGHLEEGTWAVRPHSFTLFTVPIWPRLTEGFPKGFHHDSRHLNVPVERTQISGSTFLDWVSSSPIIDEVVSINQADRLTFAGYAYARLSEAQRGQTLEQLHKSLVAEVSSVHPAQQRATYWDVPVQPLAIVVVSPLVLLILTYAFAMYTMYLKRQAQANTNDMLRFAWLPLTLRANNSWVSATAMSVVILPSVSLWFLWWRLEEFNFIDWSSGSAVMTIATISIAAFGAMSLFNVDRIRETLEKRSVRGALLEDQLTLRTDVLSPDRD